MRVWQRGQRYLLRLLWLFDVGLATIMEGIMRRGRDIDTISCRSLLVRALPSRCVMYFRPVRINSGSLGAKALGC